MISDGQPLRYERSRRSNGRLLHEESRGQGYVRPAPQFAAEPWRVERALMNWLASHGKRGGR